ncbi:MAG: hypothetical protein LBU24_05745 [Methanocalculaceae archaeon]|jgi:hypothetical protein|nr:hypothetical protein [Methanocalculaceae archaeon]
MTILAINHVMDFSGKFCVGEACSDSSDHHSDGGCDDDEHGFGDRVAVDMFEIEREETGCSGKGEEEHPEDDICNDKGSAF